MKQTRTGLEMTNHRALVVDVSGILASSYSSISAVTSVFFLVIAAAAFDFGSTDPGITTAILESLLL